MSNIDRWVNPCIWTWQVVHVDDVIKQGVRLHRHWEQKESMASAYVHLQPSDT